MTHCLTYISFESYSLFFYFLFFLRASCLDSHTLDLFSDLQKADGIGATALTEIHHNSIGLCTNMTFMCLIHPEILFQLVM